MNMPWEFYCKKDSTRTDMFNVTTCDKCGKTVTDVNAVGGSVVDIPKYIRSGMTERNMPFEELVWSEELEQGVCNECYEKALSPDEKS